MIRGTRSPPRVGIVDQGTEKVANYVALVEAAGAIVEILWWKDEPDPDADAARFDGLVLCGGDDVHARHFGEENHPAITLEDERRDIYELAFSRRAVLLEVPLLAICRGVQVLNIALGGTIEQHMPDVPGRRDHTAGVTHRLDVADDSLLQRLASRSDGAPLVNSYHHQAVGRVAPSLRATAWSDDGAVEAVEGAGRFCVGVQWHPEREGNSEPFGGELFASLVEAARVR